MDLIYQLEHRSKDLCRLCYLWSQSTSTIPAGNTDWGPSANLIDQAGAFERAAHLVAEDSPSDLQDEISEAGSLDTDGDLADHVEAAAFHDEYLDPDPLFDSEYLNDADFVELPVKRRRMDS